MLGNAQGELSPLEIGLHALECVGKSKGGKGKKGGLAEYARAIGKDRGYLSTLVQAASVAKRVGQLTGLQDRTQHLCAIHRLPEALWPAAAEAMPREAAGSGEEDARWR